MIIIILVLLFQGVFSQSITVTPNITSKDILEGENFNIEYKINPGLLTNWSVEMNFGDRPFDFFIYRGGNSNAKPEECINCNVTYNNLNTTFTLYLYNVTKNNNNGTYKFELKNVHKVTHQINVHVRELPVLSTSDLSSLEFKNLTLNCSIKTDWFDKIWWTTSNGSIINSCNRSSGHLSQTCPAVLSNVTRENQGFYTCHAENPHYNISKTVSLDIVYGPQYSIQLLITTGLESNLSTSNITVKERDVLNLFCTADCNPNCNYTWNNNNSNGSYLTVKVDRKTEYITCTTENQYGKDNASVKVNVLYSSETNLTTLNGKTTVNETDKITIKCSAMGNPKPNIIWSMEGTNRSYKKEQCSKYKPSLKSEEIQCEHLLLEDLDCFGTGNYTCTSFNGIENTNDFKTLSIIVNCKPKILEPEKKLVNVYDNWKSFNVCFTGFPVPKVILHVANNTNISNNDILTTKSNVHTIDVMVLLNNSGSGVKTGNYRLEMWNERGKDYLDIQLMSHKQHGSGDLEMIIAVAAACLILGLCFLIGVFCIRRKQIKKQTTEERSTDVQLRVPRGYDGSYRDNSLYISSGPTLTNNGDSARNVNNQRQEAAGRTTSDGSYRDNTLYAPCTTEQLQKLNAEKKSSVKETETSKRGKKQEEHCHGDDEDYQYSYVNLPENFITKQRKHKVGNHKSKKNKTSQGKKNEDTQDKRLISKRKNDMRIDEHNNMLEKSPEYEQEIEAKSNNSMDEYCAETTAPRIPPKTALAFQADYSL